MVRKIMKAKNITTY